jgi:hypothetical protein
VRERETRVYGRNGYRDKGGRVMAQGFAFKGKILCAECYEKETDIARLKGEEIPPKKHLEADKCARCSGPLEEAEEASA